MRTMYDGTAALARGIHAQFPLAEMVAGYVDGDGAEIWGADEWALWGNSTMKVEISRVAANGIGDVLDVEAGLASPAQCGAWIALRKRAGYYRPTIYCSLSVVRSVRAATGSYILGRDYDIWVADWDGVTTPVPVPGLPPAQFAAGQYESTPAWDKSAVWDDAWPHRKPPATGIPAPGGLSGTPWEFAHLKWDPVPGVRVYAVEIELASGQLIQEQVHVTSDTGPVRWQSGGFEPQQAQWRVAAMGGDWSEWKALS